MGANARFTQRITPRWKPRGYANVRRRGNGVTYRIRNGVRSMEIETTRFGTLTVDDERVMTFPRGLLGFPNHERFALIQTGEENYFFWLQSVDEPALAFVVTDPSTFFKDYEVPLREETQQEVNLTDADIKNGAVQMFVICNKVGDWLTGNLLGPIVINTMNRLATQVVLTEKKWTTRQPLLKLQSEVPLAKSA
jgi:flagellar assembly factor FliW